MRLEADPIARMLIGRLLQGHYFLDSAAIRAAKPVRTVPIIQRCNSCHRGRPAGKVEMEPAIKAISAFITRLMLPQVDALVEAVGVRAGSLRGPIHVSAPLSFGIRYRSPIVSKFMLMHPEVDVRLDLDDRYVDIGARGYDLAIRLADWKTVL